jgi:hypothetical protein
VSCLVLAVRRISSIAHTVAQPRSLPVAPFLSLTDPARFLSPFSFTLFFSRSVPPSIPCVDTSISWPVRVHVGRHARHSICMVFDVADDALGCRRLKDSAGDSDAAASGVARAVHRRSVWQPEAQCAVVRAAVRDTSASTDKGDRADDAAAAVSTVRRPSCRRCRRCRCCRYGVTRSPLCTAATAQCGTSTAPRPTARAR